MSLIQVSDDVRDRLAAVAASIGREQGRVATLGDAVEHLLDERDG